MSIYQLLIEAYQVHHNSNESNKQCNKQLFETFLQAIKSSEHLSSITRGKEDALEQLCQRFQLKQFQQRDVIFMPNQPVKDLFWILSGQISCFEKKSEEIINTEKQLIQKIQHLRDQQGDLQTQEIQEQLAQTQLQLNNLRNNNHNFELDDLISTADSAKQYFTDQGVCTMQRQRCLVPGEIAGENCVIANLKYDGLCMVTSKSCFALRLSAKDYISLFNENIDNFHFIKSALHQTFGFSHSKYITRLAYQFEKISFAYNQVIFNQGDKADCVYVVKSGEVELSITQTAENKKPKDYSSFEELSVTEQDNQEVLKQLKIKRKPKSLETQIALCTCGILGLEDYIDNELFSNGFLGHTSKHILTDSQLQHHRHNGNININHKLSQQRVRNFKAISKSSETVLFKIRDKYIDKLPYGLKKNGNLSQFKGDKLKYHQERLKRIQEYGKFEIPQEVEDQEKKKICEISQMKAIYQNQQIFLGKSESPLNFSQNKEPDIILKSKPVLEQLNQIISYPSKVQKPLSQKQEFISQNSDINQISNKYSANTMSKSMNYCKTVSTLTSSHQDSLKLLSSINSTEKNEQCYDKPSIMANSVSTHSLKTIPSIISPLQSSNARQSYFAQIRNDPLKISQLKRVFSVTQKTNSESNNSLSKNLPSVNSNQVNQLIEGVTNNSTSICCSSPLQVGNSKSSILPFGMPPILFSTNSSFLNNSGSNQGSSQSSNDSPKIGMQFMLPKPRTSTFKDKCEYAEKSFSLNDSPFSQKSKRNGNSTHDSPQLPKESQFAFQKIINERQGISQKQIGLEDNVFFPSKDLENLDIKKEEKEKGETQQQIENEENMSPQKCLFEQVSPQNRRKKEILFPIQEPLQQKPGSQSEFVVNNLSSPHKFSNIQKAKNSNANITNFSWQKAFSQHQPSIQLSQESPIPCKFNKGLQVNESGTFSQQIQEKQEENEVSLQKQQQLQQAQISSKFFVRNSRKAASVILRKIGASQHLNDTSLEETINQSPICIKSYVNEKYQNQGTQKQAEEQKKQLLDEQKTFSSATAKIKTSSVSYHQILRRGNVPVKRGSNTLISQWGPLNLSNIISTSKGYQPLKSLTPANNLDLPSLFCCQQQTSQKLN